MSFWNLLGACVVGGLAVAALVACLSLESIVDWFRERLVGTNVDAERLGVTILRHMRDGNFKVIQGVFHATTKELIEGRVVAACRVDPQLLAAHDENGVALWTV